jgi:serralysin
MGLGFDWRGLPPGSIAEHRAEERDAQRPIGAAEPLLAARGAGSLAPPTGMAWSASGRRLDSPVGDLGLEERLRGATAHHGPLAQAQDGRSLGDIWAASVLDADDVDWHRAAWPGAETSPAPVLPSLVTHRWVAIGEGDGSAGAVASSPYPEVEGTGSVVFAESGGDAQLAATTPWIPFRTTSEIKVVSETGQDYSSAVAIAVNQAATGSIGSATDVDYFKVNLTAGQTYTFAASSFGKQAITDLKIDLYQSVAGLPLLKGSDDASGPLYGAQYTVTAASTGTYFIKVSKGSEATPSTSSATGQYLLTVGQVFNPYHPVGTLSELADYMTHAHWRALGQDWAAFSKAATGPRILTYDISSLSDADQYYAVNAMANWQDVANIRFVENTGTAAADITFQNTDGESGIITSISGNTISNATILFPPSEDNYRMTYFMTGVGYSLGLGQSGPYTVPTNYGTDNIFQNDELSLSVMSGFTPDLTHSGNSDAFPSTVMLADIVAIQNLYGANTTTRTGNDIYGFNATDSRFSFSTSGSNMFTIYDRGGTDTLDASGYSEDQRIDLRAGQYSDIGDRKNLIAISTIGTVVENAKGGSGADTITGNVVGNVLAGNGGNDIIRGGNGNDTLQGGDADDQLYGEANSDRLRGGIGNDILVGGADADRFVMEAGWGSDTIQDFQDGVDKVEIYMVPGLTNFTQFSEADTGNDVRLTWNNNTPSNTGDDLTLIFVGREPAQIDASDFVFVV